MKRRRGEKGMSPFAAGAIVIAIVAIITYLVFGNDIPFTTPYQVKAVVANAQNIKTRSPVRIAGVNVGQVQKVERNDDSSTAVVTLAIDDHFLPIYKDAELKIRPRIFLEGNFFVDLQPGTPGAGKIPDNGTIPITQTAGPVQLDQVLTTLQSGTRKDLQTLITGYGYALNGKPLTPQQDADQVRAVRGLTGGQALNASLDYAPRALRGVALVNEAAQGTQIDDLSKLIAGQQKVSAALSANDQNLKDLVTNFNTTTSAFANQSQNLSSTIAQLPGVLQLANQTFNDLNAAFPPTRAFARAILPGVEETAPTIDAAFPWVAQTRALVSPQELGGLVSQLQPAVADLSSVIDESLVLLPQVELADRCAIDVVLPTGDKPIDDGFLSTGLPNYKEFWQTMTALSSESQNFDGNGQYTRFQSGGGPTTFKTGATGSSGAPSQFTGPQFLGNPAIQPLGTRPARPASQPPIKSNVACYKNQPPNLAAKTGPGF
jgi:ABC-type transporter Mla subunit MlaD